VQVHGDTAVLSYVILVWITKQDGTEGSFRENCTEVYSKIEGQWKIIHTHWSFLKPDLK